ncbi:hypothetical protein V5O48_012312 [Marasmius crinis-equi]|uniref:Uncharacterized protein n=1 Tax=Marasmius crinis-equi TaxID=585013 RepID=A0ABR3F391_9AGAR
MIDRKDSSNPWDFNKVSQDDARGPLCPGEIVLNSLFVRPPAFDLLYLSFSWFILLKPGAGRIDLEGLLPERWGVKERVKSQTSITTSGPKAHEGEGLDLLTKNSATPALSSKNDEADTRVHLLRQQLQRSAMHNMALQDRLEETEREYNGRIEQSEKSVKVKDCEMDVLRDENTALHVQMAELQTRMEELQTNFLVALDRAIDSSMGHCTICLDKYEPKKLPVM